MGLQLHLHLPIFYMDDGCAPLPNVTELLKVRTAFTGFDVVLVRFKVSLNSVKSSFNDLKSQKDWTKMHPWESSKNQLPDWDTFNLKEAIMTLVWQKNIWNVLCGPLGLWYTPHDFHLRKNVSGFLRVKKRFSSLNYLMVIHFKVNTYLFQNCKDLCLVYINLWVMLISLSGFLVLSITVRKILHSI